MSEIIPTVYLKNSLLNHSVFTNLKSKILETIKGKIPELDKLKLNHELTAIVCNLVENLYLEKNDKKVDKKMLVLDILSTIFNLSTAEQDIIKSQIQYIHDNNLIVRVSFVKRWASYAVSLFKKKFL